MFLRAMPNKNQQFRLKILDQCLQNRGKQYSVDDLHKTVIERLREKNPDYSVSKKTIYSDLKLIEDIDGYNIPIRKKKDGKYIYYRYEDPRDSIFNAMLSPEDKNILLSAVRTLLSINGLPQEEWVEQIDKVLRDDNHLDLNSKIIGLEQNLDVKGMEYLAPLYKAIMNEVVLKIQYCDFKDKKYEFLIHPYYLKQYNKRWYLICYNETKEKEYWILALDRIQDIKQLPNVLYNKNYNRDWDDYFYDIIGVTLYKDKSPEEVTLKVQGERARYVLTKPLHPSQKTKQYDGYIIVRIKVIPNRELISLILSYGDDMEVLGPESVRQEVISRVKNLREMYKN